MQLKYSKEQYADKDFVRSKIQDIVEIINEVQHCRFTVPKGVDYDTFIRWFRMILDMIPHPSLVHEDHKIFINGMPTVQVNSCRGEDIREIIIRENQQDVINGRANIEFEKINHHIAWSDPVTLMRRRYKHLEDNFKVSYANELKILSKFFRENKTFMFTAKHVKSLTDVSLEDRARILPHLRSRLPIQEVVISRILFFGYLGATEFWNLGDIGNEDLTKALREKYMY